MMGKRNDFYKDLKEAVIISMNKNSCYE